MEMEEIWTCQKCVMSGHVGIMPIIPLFRAPACFACWRFAGVLLEEIWSSVVSVHEPPSVHSDEKLIS